MKTFIFRFAFTRRVFVLLTVALLISASFFLRNATRASNFQSADLAVTKNGPDIAAAGSTITYTITVTSIGPDDALDAALNDNLPGELTFVSLTAPAGWSCSTPSAGSTGLVTCSNADVAPGDSVFTLQVMVDPKATPGTFITNIATVTSSNDSTDENNSSASSLQVSGQAFADLAVNKSGPENAQADTDVAYTITVTNLGPSTATNATLLDSLPSGVPPSPMTFVSFTQNSGPAWNCPGGTPPCTIATLPANTTSVFTLTGHIPPGTSQGTQYTNVASVSSDSDPNDENNTGSAVTNVVGPSDLTVTKTHSGTFTQADKGKTYTITVSNVGSSPTSGLVTLTDSLPAGLIARSLSGPGWTCDSIPASGTPGPATLNCSRSDSLPMTGSYADIVLTVDVSCSATNLTNKATVSGGGDGNAANNTANDPTTINPDSTPPIITCPGSITRFADPGQSGAFIKLTTPVASDACGTTITGTRSDNKPLNALFPLGTTIITWTAKDPAGNTASCTQTIVIMEPSGDKRHTPTFP